MKTTWKWFIGILIALLVLQTAIPFVWQWVFPSAGGYGFGMPMIPGAGAGMRGHGMFMPMMGFGGLFTWLIQVGLMILIALGIAFLWKKLTEKPIQ
jgi:hypothetical protein